MVKRNYDKSELIMFTENIKDKLTYFEDKVILLHFDSFCLGDTICFSSFLNPFMEYHKPKKVYLTTFFPHLLESNDERVEIISATQKGVHLNVDKYITVGYDKNSLEHTLGGMMYAVKDTMFIPQNSVPGKCPVIKKERKIVKNKVSIAPESLKKIAQWNYVDKNGKSGWQGVVDNLVERGCKVYNISYEDRIKLNNVKDFHGFDDLNVSLNHILESEFFIGLSSGLAWLAWAYNVPVIMISNFTKEHNEFSCYRVKNDFSCSGCFNLFKNIQSSCPIFEGSPRENECHLRITNEMVIDKVDELILHEKIKKESFSKK